MTTVVHLVRHADHGHVGRVLTGRLPGMGLSDAGRGQAGALAHRMATARPDALISSPCLRAQQTAHFISRATGRDFRISDALDEIDFGRWSGRSFEELERDPDWRRWNAERDTAATPAGETMSEVADRACGLIFGLRQHIPDGSACVVSHGDVIKSVICRMTGRPFRSAFDFEIAPASVTTLTIEGRAATLLAVNAAAPAQIGEAAL